MTSNTSVPFVDLSASCAALRETLGEISSFIEGVAFGGSICGRLGCFLTRDFLVKVEDGSGPEAFRF